MIASPLRAMVIAGQRVLKYWYLVLVIIGVVWGYWRLDRSKVKVPEYPRTISMSIQTPPPTYPNMNLLHQSFATKDSFDTVVEFYRHELTTQGWRCYRQLVCTRNERGEGCAAGAQIGPCSWEHLTLSLLSCPTVTCVMISVDAIAAEF